MQKALAAYLRDSRGVRCAPEQIAITTGSQQALFFLPLLMIRASTTVYGEDPRYPGRCDVDAGSRGSRRRGATR